MEQRFVLELEGRLAGRMFSAEGGLTKSESADGSHGFSGKRVTFEVEPLVCVFGTGMSRGFYDWIGESMGGRSLFRRSGSMIELDHHSKMVRRRQFTDALVTEVVFPELDASSKKEAVMKIKLMPERVRDTADGVKDLGVYVSSLAKAWSVNHFRMWIDGLDTDCAKITKITGLSVQQGVKRLYVGDDRFPTHEPAKLSLSNITVEMPLGYGTEFTKWFEDSADPRKAHVREKEGTIEFLAPGTRSAYFAVMLKGMGIVSWIKKASSYRAELVYQSLKMSAGGAAVK